MPQQGKTSEGARYTSHVQMPKGIPVATVGIDNSTNAAMLAIQIMALKNTKLKNQLKKYREDMQKKF